MKIDILSLFPGYFQGPFDESIIKRAKERGLLEIGLWNIRDCAEGKHRKVDDRSFGGGPGMVLMAPAVVRAIRKVRQPGAKVIYLTPQGERLTAKKCRQLAQESHLILLCGHYEGVDERIIDLEVDETISIGDYVLTSGCPAAIVLVDSIARFIPGVVGNEESVLLDSFEEGQEFDWPHYTTPVEFEGLKVPEVLRSGDHKKIQEWRKNAAKEKRKK